MGTASAHTRAELDEWTVAWVQQVNNLDSAMLVEWHQMVALHPWYYIPQVRQPTPFRPTGTTFTGIGSGVERWRPLVAVYFAPELVEHALCIMDHESGGNPNADNPRSTAAGLFQFLRDTWNRVPVSITGGSYDSGRVYDPEANIAAAAWLQQRGSGWGQWTVAPRC